MPEPIVVTVDQAIEDLIPLFMAQRKADQSDIATALPLRDFAALCKTAHGMTGAGASYGFDRISDLGDRLSEAARAGDINSIHSVRDELDDYLKRLIVKYA